MTLLSSYIENFKNINVLVIGDIILDSFIYGKIDRISPEAPVPIFQFGKEKKMLGGSGNVVANLTSLSCKVNFIGAIGKDENGKKISSLLDELGANSHLLYLDNYSTIIKTRLIANHHHIVRVDQEEKVPSTIIKLLPRYKKVLTSAIQKVDIVLISDYNKGLITPVTSKMIIEICNHFNKKVIIDPKGNDYSKYNGATLVKPNLQEFSDATRMTYNPDSSDFHNQIKEGAKILFENYQIENLIITLSEHGMIHVSKDNPDDLIQIPTVAKEVYDVSGAGDTSLATLGASMGAGITLREAMKLANIASGIVVSKLGTATVTINEIKKSISTNEFTDYEWPQEKKIISLEEAKEIIANLKQNGKKIGFTNGCFDCCHLGHLNSFMQIKKLCDVLIVAVNSDSSVKAYKGENRPIQDEKTRITLLASLEFIDYVIVFEEDSPLHIVEDLKPDIVAKEGYTLDKWAEGRLALSYGGQAITLKRIEGYSTSSLIEKIKG